MGQRGYALLALITLVAQIPRDPNRHLLDTHVVPDMRRQSPPVLCIGLVRERLPKA
jgi:hypothetical protein